MSYFTHECPVRFTEKAMAQIRQIIHQKEIDLLRYGLRIGIRGSGCGGAAPLLGFDTSTETDHRYLLADFSVLIDKKHWIYVLDMEIDYEENDVLSGFVFHSSETKTAD